MIHTLKLCLLWSCGGENDFRYFHRHKYLFLIVNLSYQAWSIALALREQTIDPDCPLWAVNTLTSQPITSQLNHSPMPYNLKKGTINIISVTQFNLGLGLHGCASYYQLLLFSFVFRLYAVVLRQRDIEFNNDRRKACVCPYASMPATPVHVNNRPYTRQFRIQVSGFKIRISDSGFNFGIQDSPFWLQ